MNKKYFNFLICFIIFLILYEIFDHTNLVIQTIYDSTNLWYFNIVPSILPIYIIIDLLLNYKGIDYLSYLFGNFMEKFFKLKRETSFVFILSLISGFPSNSKYLKSLLDDKVINTNEANKLLLFTHFSNPLFIIGSIGNNFLHDKKIGIIILIVHYLSNFLIGFFGRNYYVNLESGKKDIKKQEVSFISCLTNSIYNTIKILFLLYGIITFFMIITAIIKVNIPINSVLNSILCGLLEMTQGIKFVSGLNIPINVKASIITFFISFGSFSIHMQVLSILNSYKIKYKDYLLARIIHAFVSSSIVYLILTN